MKSNLAAWRERVTRATTPVELDKLDASLARLWNAETLTPTEFKRMDAMTCDRRIALENPTTV